MEFEKGNCSQFEDLSFCSNNQYLVTRLGLYIFFTCSITITVFGSLDIIITIAHFRQLHSATNLLILSLSSTDMCIGIFIMPYSMVRTVENCWYFGNLYCKIHYGFDLTLSVISIFHLCIIAVDRLYAVCKPLYYPVKITLPVIKRLVLFCWTAPMIFSLGVVISNSHVSGIEGYDLLVQCFNVCPITFNKLWTVVIFFTCFFSPAALMVVIYVKIFLVSQKHAKFIKNAAMDSNTSQTVSKRKEHKAARKLAILMGVFLSCWVPIFVILLIHPFINFSSPKVIFEVFNWFSYINSTCNPILYGFLYPWFRNGLKHIISCRICYSG
ncbi:PREDICTED: trace amine-associated receptor 2-like [Nanorana parkeri]|uniref:trace amine-associated receptor 2-like n=1 Tax=Nanorana parkeri TaxID=125878 RepID=UPI0008545446|nr:PREDICTED: trace amine-associated receptor 2-like [Nanorana parkeri]